YACGPPMCGCAIREKSLRSMAFASVAVPTVDRGFDPSRSWSTMMAVVSPSRTSTSGRPGDGMKPWTNAGYVTLMSLCDSAAIVPNTRELFPEPDTPVKTVSRRLGSERLTSARLFSRAPCTRMRWWESAVAVVSVTVLSSVMVSRRGVGECREQPLESRALGGAHRRERSEGESPTTRGALPRPRADDAPPADRRALEDAVVPGDERGVVGGAHERQPIGVAEDQLIEARQEEFAHRVPLPRRVLLHEARSPVRGLVSARDRPRLHGVDDERKRGADDAQRQLGPPREVTQSGRSVRLQVAAQELRGGGDTVTVEAFAQARSGRQPPCRVDDRGL